MPVSGSDGSHFETEWEDAIGQLNEQKYLNSVRDSHLNEAHDALNLTEQERNLYHQHLYNLQGSGGVDNPDGSRSTLFAQTATVDGRTYIMPRVQGGKMLSPDETYDKYTGGDLPMLHTLPSYGSQEEAVARYGQLHSFMEKDTNNLQNNQKNLSSSQFGLPLPPEDAKFINLEEQPNKTHSFLKSLGAQVLGPDGVSDTIDRRRKEDRNTAPYVESVAGGDFNDPYRTIVDHLEKVQGPNPLGIPKAEDFQKLSWRELLGVGLNVGMNLVGSGAKPPGFGGGPIKGRFAPSPGSFEDMIQKHANASPGQNTLEGNFIKQPSMEQTPFNHQKFLEDHLDWLSNDLSKQVESGEIKMNSPAYQKQVDLMHGISEQIKTVKAEVKPWFDDPKQWETFQNDMKEWSKSNIGTPMPDNIAKKIDTVPPKGWDKIEGELFHPEEQTQGEHVDAPMSPVIKELHAQNQATIEKLGIKIPEPAAKAGFTTVAFRAVGKPPREVPHVEGHESYTAANPDLSNLYAKGSWSGGPDKVPQSVPLLLKTDNYLVWDAKGGAWSNNNFKAIQLAKSMNKQGVVMHNVWDEPNSTAASSAAAPGSELFGTQLGKPQTVYIVLDPKSSRSRFAKFKDTVSPHQLGMIPLILLAQPPDEAKAQAGPNNKDTSESPEEQAKKKQFFDKMDQDWLNRVPSQIGPEDFKLHDEWQAMHDKRSDKEKLDMFLEHKKQEDMFKMSPKQLKENGVK